MKKVKKSFKNIFKNILKYIYSNRLFLSYLVLSIIGTMVVRHFTIGGFCAYKPLICDIGFILLIGAFGYLVKPKNQFKYFLAWLIFFSLVEVINSIYYMWYASFASLTELSTVSQLETVTDSVLTQLRIIDFIYILEPIIFYYIHNSLRKSSYYNLIGKVEKKMPMFITTLIVSLVFIGYTFASASGADYSRLSKQWNRVYIVERFGIIMYQFNDAVQTVIPKLSSLFGYEDAYNLVNDYFNDETIEKYDSKNKYSGILKDYNIIYIHMESMQNFLMSLSFNGEEVTPNLNKLSKEGMFFSNFYPEVSVGTSSDAEYITLTGLLPSSNGPVFVSYSDNTFRTLPQFLKERGYYTFSMHGNYQAMWNRNNVHPRLGYTDMYYRDTFTFNNDSKDPNNTDWVGLGINDELFFAQAVDKLKVIESEHQNYFGTLITLSNHSPFAPNPIFTLNINDYFTDSYGEQTSTCYLCERDVGKYIVSANYADKALGEFIDLIKNSEEFENTLFVFYGDHDAKLSYKDMNYLYNYDPVTGELKDELDPTYVDYDSYDHQLNKKTPLIFWTKNEKLSKILKGEVKYTMGMDDLAPTLFNMLDIDYDYTLGHDIFNIKDNNIVVFPNGNFLTKEIYYNNSTSEYKVFDGGTIDTNYLMSNIERSERALEVGNAIITYDLFNERKRAD